MSTHLIPHGNHLALVIEDSTLDQLQITAQTPLELTTQGNQIVVTPGRDEPRPAQLRAALEKINQQHGADLERLAR